ncbi:hypothetical protein [Parahalioglobus pacificus]|uniref:Uncharacterized protein n=1 Tax=Parahalioglobus pacificus TaxID=930806 RepID=A0A918XLI9_9GAMM|nr:hypothetical protein [Halioglobus pacificus]GHD37791.1 hypothetical protein GCM10007053_27270 [Halioglobus pacificus]
MKKIRAMSWPSQAILLPLVFMLLVLPDVGMSDPERISLQDIRGVAMDAAKELAPGVSFQSAESSYWDDEPVYVLHGARFNEVWRICVTHMGVIKEVSVEDRDE